MKAIVLSEYGSPDVLKFDEVDKPVLEDDQVLVRVDAASVNPLDWHGMRGEPYIMRLGAGLTKPKTNGLGADLAGRVEAVGKDVIGLQPGDEVFGVSIKTCAEYVRVSQDGIVAKPTNLTFEQAAAVPVAALTALQGLRDKAQVQPGQKVLINGAAGGVGTFAVQIAKVFGADVTGVCSTRNLDLVRSIGADHVIDYTTEDFTRGAERYDIVFDGVGNRSLSQCRRVLKPNGTLLLVGAADGRWIGPMLPPLKAMVVSRFVSQKLIFFISKRNQADLLLLKDMIETGKVTPVIDRSYPLSNVPDAILYLEEGHARGKVVITV
jgi:NADPH:quinone reductase-like Zn-dependent oxidoreductase